MDSMVMVGGAVDSPCSNGNLFCDGVGVSGQPLHSISVIVLCSMVHSAGAHFDVRAPSCVHTSCSGGNGMHLLIVPTPRDGWQLASCESNLNGFDLANSVLDFSGVHQADSEFCQADAVCPEGSVVLELVMVVANIPFVSLRSIRGQGREEEDGCAFEDSVSVPINHVSVWFWCYFFWCLSMESGTVTATVGKERPGSRELILFVLPMAAFWLCGEPLLQCFKHQGKWLCGFVFALLLCYIKCQGSWPQVNSPGSNCTVIDDCNCKMQQFGFCSDVSQCLALRLQSFALVFVLLFF
jgi:hypothetical protein